jgi:hypothetical protein
MGNGKMRMHSRSLDWSTRFLVLLALGLATYHALAQSADVSRAGIVDFVIGSVTVTPAKGARADLQEGAVVRAGDTIETSAIGEAHLKMEDGGFLALRPGTVVEITNYQARGEKDDHSTITLLQGALRSVTGWIGTLNSQGYRIITPVTMIGVRGTDHETVHITANSASAEEIAGTHEQVYRGATFIQRDGQILEIPEGRAGYAGLNGKTELHEKIPAYLERRRTKSDGRVERHSLNAEHHIEEKLRDGGHLKPNESAKQFFERKQAIVPGKTPAPVPPRSKPAPNPTHMPKAATNPGARVSHSTALTAQVHPTIQHKPRRTICTPQTIIVAGKSQTTVKCRPA